MVVNKKESKIYKLLLLQVTFFSLKFLGTLFVGTDFVVFVTFVSIILPHEVTESSIILTKYSLFSQVHAAGPQIYFLPHALYSFGFLRSHQSYSTFDLNDIFYHQIYIYIRVIHVLLIFLIHFFLQLY